MSQFPTELKVLLAASFGLIFVHTAPDPDLFGRLIFAADAARDGLPATDPYNFTAAGARWINHEWLSEWAFYRVWLLGGKGGLQLLKALLLACAFTLVMVRASRVHASTKVAVGMLLSALPAVSMYRLGVRPGLFTLALTAVVCLILTEAREHPRVLWALPAVFLAWINLHGGVVAGLAIVLAWTAVSVLRPSETQRLTLRSASGPLLAVGAALFVNPYGYELPSFLAWASTMPRPLIVEWAPLHTSPVPFLAFSVPLLLCAAGWIWSPLERNAADLAVCVAVTGQALLHQRHASLAVIATLIFSLPHVDAAARPVIDRLRRSRLPGQGAPVPSWARAIGWSFAALLVSLMFLHLGCWNTSKEFPIPTGAANFLRDSGFRGNLVTPYNWGEFLINRLSPAVRVSMDGRYETVYPLALVERQYDFMQAEPGWESYLDDYRPDAVLTARGAPVGDRLAEHTGWAEVYRDDLVRIFSPADRTDRFNATPRATSASRSGLVRGHGPCFAEPLMFEQRYVPAAVSSVVEPR